MIKVSVKIPSSLFASIKTKVKATSNKAIKVAVYQAKDMVLGRLQYFKMLGAQNALEYAKSLSTEVDGDRAILKLEGFGADLEKGYASFDMKKGILAKATKFNKSGSPYADIPFSHNEKALPPKVQADMRALVKAAKNKLATVRREKTTVGKTVTKTLLPSGQKLTTTHKSGIHDALMRIPQKKGGAKYLTIRRVSANSDPTAWIHPGFAGIHLLKSMAGEIRRKIKQNIKEIILEGLKK